MYNNRVYTFLLWVVFLLFHSLSCAQVYCKGIVRDIVDDAPLDHVSVLIKDSLENIIQYGFTNEKGEYEIALKSEGHFLVMVNKVGYFEEQKKLTTSSDKKNYILNFYLAEKIEELKEIVIDIESPIKQKGDTLVYDARSFETGEENVVEDLIKKIPGLSVNNEGKIKFYGKEITKVMVEGDDLFNSGYSILTKNMPNKPVDKIEVIRNYSENKLLAEIEKIDQTAINITIDDAYKTIWFGDIWIQEGYGEHRKFESAANLMAFKKNTKTFLSINANNTGSDQVGSIEQMFYNNRDIPTIQANNLYKVLSINTQHNPFFKKNRTLLNNSKNFSMSTTYTLSNKLKTKIIAFLGLNKESYTTTKDQYIETEQIQYTNTTNNQSLSKINNGYINFSGSYDINNNNMLQFSTVWNIEKEKNNNNFIFNSSEGEEALKTFGRFIDQKVSLTHKWNEKNAVIIKGRIFQNKKPQDYTTNFYFFDSLFEYPNITKLDNQLENQELFAGLEADFKMRKSNKNFINFLIGYNFISQDLENEMRLYDNEKMYLPNDFQPQITYQLSDIYTNFNYNIDFNKLFFKLNANIHQVYNQWGIKEKKIENQSKFYIDPSLSIIWKINPSQTISANFNLKYRPTDFYQTNNAYLLTSSQNFRKGIGVFELIDTHDVSINYVYRHYLNRFSYQVSSKYSRANQIPSTISFLSQNSTLTQTILINDGDAYHMYQTLEYYARKWQSYFNFDNSFSYRTSYNAINGSELRKNNYQNIRVATKIRTAFPRGLNFNFGTEWSLSKINNNQTYYSSNNYSYITIKANYFDSFNIETTLEYYYLGGVEQNKKTQYMFLDIETSYNLSEKWKLFFKLNNVLNQKELNRIYISDIGYAKFTQKIIPRYFLLGIKYRFEL